MSKSQCGVGWHVSRTARVHVLTQFKSTHLLAHLLTYSLTHLLTFFLTCQLAHLLTCLTPSRGRLGLALLAKVHAKVYQSSLSYCRPPERASSVSVSVCPCITFFGLLFLRTPCETIVTQTDLNRNANSVLGRACARSSTLYTQRHTPRLHRLLDTQA